MKKVILIMIIFAMLVGCGSKPEASANASSASITTNTPKSGSFDCKSLITDEALKSALIGKKFEYKYRVARSAGITEREDDKDFVISEITDISFTMEEMIHQEIGSCSYEINGTLQAKGNAFDSSVPIAVTAAPAPFAATISASNDGTLQTHYFSVLSPPFIKPLEPLDVDNLVKYFQNYQDSSIYKIDFKNPDVRIVVVENPFPDDDLIRRDLVVDIFEGETYICTGKLGIAQFTATPEINLNDLRKSR